MAIVTKPPVDKINPLAEVGTEGLNAFYGHVSESFVERLYWPKAYDVYNEMRRRDPTLRSVLNAVKMLARQSIWKAEPPTDKPADIEAAEFLQSCIEDMQGTVDDLIDDIMTFLPFGWSSFNVVYKRRAGSGGKRPSVIDDGRVGWDKFAFRRQSSLSRWEFDDENGDFIGWWQMAAPDFREVYLPSDSLLHFVGERDGGNPEGLSLFESAYESFHFVKNLQIISGIGWQRAFVGLPVFEFEKDPTANDIARVEAVGRGISVDSQQFASIPPGIKFRLESVANSGADALLDTIRFHRLMMTQLVMADFIFLGSGDTGSYSLAQDKSEIFLMAVNGYLDKIAAVWNEGAVKRLFELNPFPGVTETPRITHTQVRKPKLGELGEFVQRISSFITFSDDDEIWLRAQTGMPEKVADEDSPEEGEPGTPSDDMTPETGTEEADDAEASEPFRGSGSLGWAEYP